MADVFLSYSRKQQTSAQRIADALCQAGLSVFWDRDIEAGTLYRPILQQELRAALVVVVLWCNDSVDSPWVLDEAEEAQSLGTLLPALISPTPIPLGFRQIQALNLTTHASLDLDCDMLVGAVRRRLRRQNILRREDALPAAITSIYESTQAMWRPGLGDSLLLRPEEHAVPFSGEARKSILAQLVAWCNSNNRIHSLRIIAGVAGAGKTRLVLELCHALRERGWAAGFLSTALDTNLIEQFRSWWRMPGPDRFVAVDYAEARPDAAIALLETLLNCQPKYRVRIVFIARNTQSWWFDVLIRSKHVRALAESKDFEETIWLDSFESNEAEWQQYTAALRAFASTLNIPIPDYLPETQADFLIETCGEPLYAHMAALCALRGDEPRSLPALIRSTLLRERSFWSRLLQRAGLNIDAFAPLFSQLVAVITLLGGLQTKERVLEIVRALLPHPENTLDIQLRLYYLMYQAYPRGSSSVDALRPDRIGETLIMEELAIQPKLLYSVIGFCSDRAQAASTLAILERLSVRHSPNQFGLDPNLLTDGINMLFRRVRPRTAEIITRALASAGGGQKLLTEAQTMILMALKNSGLIFEMRTGVLSTADIYQRMKSRHISLSQVKDIFWIDIITERAPDCYLLMGLVSQKIKPIPGTFKDFIAIPKGSGYQALHLNCIHPRKIPLFLRIMTKAMWTYSSETPLRPW